MQSAINLHRERYEIPNSSVVAETIKLFANKCSGYQTMQSSHHTVKNFLSDEKTYAAINTKLLKRLDYVNDLFYEVLLAKAEIELK